MQRRDLWVMAIAKSQPNKHVLLRPEVKYVGNINGNEISTGEVLLKFIQHLLINPNNDTRVDELLEKTRIHILVSMYPDDAKRALVRRDLASRRSKRSNPSQDRIICNNAVDTQSSQPTPESLAVQKWSNSEKFLLSGELLHTSAAYSSEKQKKCQFSPQASKYAQVSSANDDVMTYLASQYGNNQETTISTPICNGLNYNNGLFFLFFCS